MRVARLLPRSFALAAGFGALVSCTQLLGYDSATTISLADAGDAGDAALADPFAGRSFDAASLLPDADASAPPSCSADTANDARNCGRCGHQCETTCSEGRCAPRILVAKTVITLAQGVTILRVAGGLGYVGIEDGRRGFQKISGAPMSCPNYMDRYLIYSFRSDTPSTMQLAGGYCYDRQRELVSQARWFAHTDGVYVWQSNFRLVNGSEYTDAELGTLKKYGPVLPSGTRAENAGTPVITGIDLPSAFYSPDPADPTADLALVGGAFKQLRNGTLGPSLGGWSEAFYDVDAQVTTTEFFLSRFSSGVLLARNCDAGAACRRDVALPLASPCGHRRVGSVVLSCSIQGDQPRRPYNLVLSELNIATGATRVLNVAPLVERGGNGAAIVTPMLLSDDGVYVVRGLQIDLLPRQGVPIPISLSGQKPVALAMDGNVLYWHDGNVIYRTIP
jgi:hypothetical protein